MISARMVVLFVHVTAVIVALGASLFSTFALAPILAEELDATARTKVARRVVRRLGTIVLAALAILILTGIGNLYYFGAIPPLLVAKLVLVAIAIVLALYQYGSLGAEIWTASASGPSPEVAALQFRFRRIGLTLGTIVLIIVYMSLGLTRAAGVFGVAAR